RGDGLSGLACRGAVQSCEGKLRRRRERYPLADHFNFLDLGHAERLEEAYDFTREIFGRGRAGRDRHALDTFEPLGIDLGSVSDQMRASPGTFRHFLQASRV